MIRVSVTECLNKARGGSMPFSKFVVALTMIATLANMTGAFAAIGDPEELAPEQQSERVMIILRGIAGHYDGKDWPRGALYEEPALEYAKRLGYHGVVLDVAGWTGEHSEQVRSALKYIRSHGDVTAIYGFSGGGYNARVIWEHLSEAERDRVQTIIVVGSPGVDESDFDGKPQVFIQPDPPEGHMAGPKALLESLGAQPF